MADRAALQVFSAAPPARAAPMKRLSLLASRPSFKQLLSAAILLPFCELAVHAAAPVATMIVLENKDVSGTVYKKLGLPERKYCWDACVREERCSGVRWGVIEGDEAGLCLLITGPL